MARIVSILYPITQPQLLNPNPKISMRNITRAALLMLSSGALLMPLHAQEQIDATVGTVGSVANDGPLPQGGKSLVNGAPITGLKLAGRMMDQASVQTVDVTGQPFAQALRVRVKSQTPDNAIVLQGEPFGAVKSGDTLFFRLYMAAF